MIRKIKLSELDKKATSNIEIDKTVLEDDFFDYSKVVVKKPWGYEYLIYKNNFIAVWILFIKKGFQTSMHCHPKKKTSLIVLSGNVVSSTLSERYNLTSSEGLLLDKGVFHSTKSLSDGGAFVMEIETPLNKRDLVRLKDEYGREGKGYETIDDMSFNLQNYNYISFIDQDVYYNVKKRFGKCSILLNKFSDYDDFKENFKVEGWDAVSILKGQILDEKDHILLDVGDTLSFKDISTYKNIKINNEIEVIIIKKIDNMIKLSDFVVSFLEKNKLKGIFAVPGSTNVHLIDSLGRNTHLMPIFTQTEQAATMSAESYAKLTGNPGVSIISSGTSGTNALIGVADAWVDSTPLIVLSGQSSSDLNIGKSSIRQLGVQELDITNIVKPITKYSVMLSDPYMIKYHLEKALFLAKNGRPGPVWIDIPIDILGMNIDEEELKSFDHSEIKDTTKPDFLSEKISETISLLKSSKRPVILAGNGIRLSKVENEFFKLINLLNIPVLTSRRCADILSNDDPLFFGRPGAYGQRSANFIIQNSDLLISIGSRLSLPQIGRNYIAFARKAKKVIVDIDKNELEKKTIAPDVAIHSSAKECIIEFLSQLKNNKLDINISDWIKRCHSWKSKFSRDYENTKSQKKCVDAYHFIDSLSDNLNEDDVITVDGGSTVVFVMQAFKFKSGQRMISANGLENTSFSLPASIGASVGDRKRRVICLCENTGFQKNIQELESIIKYKLPVKIFILNGRRNLYLRKTQEAYFGKRFVGLEDDDTVSSPDILKLGGTYGFSTFKINNYKEIRATIKDVLAIDGPAICLVNIDKDQEIIPRMVFTVKPDGKWLSKPLEDMYPFLDRKELKDNMIIGVLDEN